jgi:hypothetical protein
MATPEGKVKVAVVKLLRQYNVYYFFPPANGYGRSGIPDIVCCVNGHFLAIECKAEGKNMTALQFKECDKIKAAKGYFLMVDGVNLPELEKGLKELTHADKESNREAPPV